MKNLIDIKDLSINEIEELIKVAKDIMQAPEKYYEKCKHKKLATLFFEPSTRTRLSFEAAMIELGGNVIGFSSADSSSTSKGESVADTIRVVGCYSDIIAMRHPKEGAPLVAALKSTVPIGTNDEIEKDLALDVTPVSWPIGMGRDFYGCYDIIRKQVILMDKSDKQKKQEGKIFSDLEDENLQKIIPRDLLEKLKEDLQMIEALCKPFDKNAYLQGSMTPVFFGSAVNNFGVKELLDGLLAFAPYPRPQPTKNREVIPDEEKVSGFIFKIQANMDPKHRDRIAFMRLCSGHFYRGIKLLHVRSGKIIPLPAPVMFLAQEREIAQDAFPGDIIGIPNHGNLRIGDALTEGEKLSFTGIPSFAPEILQKARPKDPLKAKHLGKALLQIAEEGGASVFKPLLGADWIVGVVGALQFEVLADRSRTEYDIPVIFEPTSLYTARWVEGNNLDIKKLLDTNRSSLAEDYDGAIVFLARNAWHMDKIQEDFPNLKFLKVRQCIL